MAVIASQSALFMNTINFYDVNLGAYDIQFLDNIYLSSGGYVFEDMYNVFWYD